MAALSAIRRAPHPSDLPGLSDPWRPVRQRPGRGHRPARGLGEPVLWAWSAVRSGEDLAVSNIIANNGVCGNRFCLMVTIFELNDWCCRCDAGGRGRLWGVYDAGSGTTLAMAAATTLATAAGSGGVPSRPANSR